MKSLKSSVEKLGDKVTQIIHFSGGQVKTFKEVRTSTIVQNNGFTGFDLESGTCVQIKTSLVNYFLVVPEKPRPISGCINAIICFKDGNKATFQLAGETRTVSEFTRFVLEGGEMLYLNNEMIIWTETFL